VLLYRPNNHSAEAVHDGLVPLIRTLPTARSLVEEQGLERALAVEDRNTRFRAICIKCG
jgi:hypothetical protein